MGWDVLEVSYYFLAPLSVAASVVLIVLFVLVQELRTQHGWFILWQCIAQAVLDLHWLSTSQLLPHE